MVSLRINTNSNFELIRNPKMKWRNPTKKMFWYFSDFCVGKQIFLWFQRNLMVLYNATSGRGTKRLKFYQNSIIYEIKTEKLRSMGKYKNENNLFMNPRGCWMKEEDALNRRWEKCMRWCCKECEAFNNRGEKSREKSFHVTSLSNFFQFVSFTCMFVLQTAKLKSLDFRLLIHVHCLWCSLPW